MKTKGKLITTLISILLICTMFSLIACSADDAEPTEAETTAAEAAVTTTAESTESTMPEDDSAIKGRFILAGVAADSDQGNPYQIWLDIDFTAEEGTDAWTKTTEILTEAGYAYVESEWGNHLQKLTPPADLAGQTELESGVTNGENSAWMWSYNDNIDKSAHEHLLEDGDVIRWYFTNDWSQNYNGHPEKFIPEEGNSIEENANAKRPVDLDSWWPAFGGSMAHNSTKQLDYPLKGFAAKEVFALQKEGDWLDAYSDPIQVDDFIYIVFSDTLMKLNRDGSLAAEAKLQFPIDSTSRIAYADGLILVPMKYGKIQALTADSLTTVWAAEAPGQILIDDPDMGVTIPYSQQSLTSLTISEGVIYQGLCNAGWSERSLGGVYRALSIEDGSTIWEYRSNESGFYWSGAALNKGVLIVGNDAGEILALDPADGAVIDNIALPASEADGLPPVIRTNMIVWDDYVYFVSQDGNLNRLEVDDNGALGELTRVQFCEGSSTASPTIVDGKVYVGGLDAFAIIDADSMAIDKSYALEGVSQSTPLVVKDGADNIFVYFTINKEPGAIYGLTPDEDTVQTVYTPSEGQQNFCMASVSISPDGTLYYTNDSHTFFAVQLEKGE